jgi:predicted Zn-dependent protease
MRLIRRNRERELAAAIERGRALIAEEKNREALEILEKAAQDFPESPEVPLMMATVYREFRPRDASALLTKAAELGSDDPVIQVMVGHRRLNEGDVEAARICAARAEHQVDDEFALMADYDRLVGRIAARDGDYDFAEEKLRSAMRREPHLPTHSLDLARFLWARGRNGEALTAIDQSVEQVSEEVDKILLERLRSEIRRAN